MTLSEPDSRCWPTLPLVATVGVVYFLAAVLGRVVSLPGLPVPIIWPATGVLLGILSRLPLRRWPVVLPAVIVAGLAADALMGWRENGLSIAYLAVNLFEACSAAWLLQQWTRGPYQITQAHDIGGLIVIALMLCSMTAALLGATLGVLLGEPSDIPHLWQRWWAAGSMGVAMFTPPVVLLAARDRRFRLRPLRVAEAAVLGIALVVISGAIFGAWPETVVSTLRFPMYAVPLVAWAGIRFGRQGVSFASLVVALFACSATPREMGWYTFLELPAPTRLAALQGFVLITCTTPLFLATVYDAQSRSDRRFRTLVAHSPTVVFETDTTGRCTYVNPRWTQLTGKPREMALGFEWISTVHEEDRERVFKAWLEMTARGEETPSLECRYYGIDDAVHWVIMNAVAMRDGGELIGYLGTILDITDRREAELQLQESYEELEQRVEERTAELTYANDMLRHEFAERIRAEEQLQQQQSQLAHVSRLSTLGQRMAGLAHEVNQPLYAISNYARGMLRRLQSGERPVEETTEALENMASEAERAGEILRRVRSFARRQQPGVAQVALQDLIHDVVRLTAFEARRRDVDVRLQLSESPIFVACDPIQIQQVLVNLVRNAFEAMEGLPVADQVVTIETFVAEGEAGCAVSDTGPGITSEGAERIFDPFFTTKLQGLGMGLPISRSLVEAFNGRLWIEPRLGNGATFCFTLPRVEAEKVGQHECYSPDRVSG